MSALADTKIPKIKASINQLTDELEFELVSHDATWSLPLESLESLVLVTLGEFQGQYVVDLSSKEYMACQAVHSLVIEKTRVVSMSMSRGEAIPAMGLVHLPALAVKQASLMVTYLQKCL